jgi:hypothetical protein
MPSSPTGQSSQGDWRRPADPKRAALGEPIGRVRPLLTPNPARPFTQYDWRRPADPIRLKAVGEPIGRVSPLLTPNPARPFHQDLWENEGPRRKALGEPIGGVNSLLTPNPATPFRQSLWEGVRALPKATGEATAGDAPLLTPNPARPFIQNDWLQIAARVKANVDDGVNLLPVQGGVVVVAGVPFYQADWPLPHGTAIRTDQGALLGSNLGLLGLPAPVVVSGLRITHFTRVTPLTPDNGYIIETDVGTFYVAEDGTTFYIQET